MTDFSFAAGAASIDVDLANDIIQLAVASGEYQPFQQVLTEYKAVSALPKPLLKITARCALF